MKNRPPQLAQRFFKWYCRNHLQDSILGDLEERFEQNLERKGLHRAQLNYWLDTLRFINRHTLKRKRYTTHFNHSNMIWNYLLTCYRFLMNHKGYTGINIFGLTIGLASCFIILLHVNHEVSFDQFHTNNDNIYRINFSFKDNAGNVTRLVNSPPALAPGIRKGQFPELARVSQMRYAMNCLFSYGDTQYYENHGYYADSVFLKILRFEWISGDPKDALNEPNSLVITEGLAMKYFGTSNAIGKTLVFNQSTPLKITGVLRDLPTNSHLNFDFLISFQTYHVPDGYASDLSSWSWLGFMTYVELHPRVDPSLFEQKLEGLFKDLNPNNPNPMRPEVQPLLDIYLGSKGMADDLASHLRTGNRDQVNALVTISILILIVAGFNYANLAGAISVNRARSTGIRKVLGASKRHILHQLMIESLILTQICLILSIAIGYFAFPFLSNYMGWELTPGIQAVWQVLPGIAIVGVIIGLCSGIIPAMALSGRAIIPSLKGAPQSYSDQWIQPRNILVVVQFAISIGLIASTIVMNRQVTFLKNMDPGYQSENVVLVKMLPEEVTRYYEQFKTKITRNTSVINVSRSDRVVGEPWPWSVARRIDQGPEQNKRVFFNVVDYDYFETMGIPLTEGRGFSKDFQNETHASVILNKSAVSYLGLKNPIGKKIHFMNLNGPRTIVGVVEDFSFNTLHEETGPAVGVLPVIDLEHIYIRFAGGNAEMNIRIMENTWKEVAQGSSPLSWKFLDDDLDQLYHSEQKLSHLIQALSTIAILLACLGLYSMVTFVINSRIKEIGVRKVLGASIPSIYRLLVEKYLFQATLASFLILPIAHYFLHSWLENFAYHISIHWLIYLVSCCILVMMIVLSISYKVLVAARVNPTSLLRSE